MALAGPGVTRIIMHHLLLYVIIFLTFAFLFQLDFVFYIIYVCVAVYGYGVWLVPWTMRQLRVERDYADHAFLGETVPVTLRIRNPRRLPLPWIQFRDSLPPQLHGDHRQPQIRSLAGRSEVVLHYQIWAARRGYYRLGPLLLSVGDHFGFAEQSGRAPESYLTVYPRLIPLTGLGLPSRLPFGTIGSRQRLFEDPARPQGVRDYRAGDSLRRIHWKASAHTNNLLVKTLEPAISLETAILLNLDRDDFSRRNRYEGPEWGIVVAASLAAHLIDRRQAVGLASNGLDPLPGERSGRLLFDEDSGRLQLPEPASAAAETSPSATSAASPGSAAVAGARPGPGRSAAGLAGAIAPGRGRPHLMKILEVLARIEAGETVSFSGWLPGTCVHLSWGVTLLVITPRGDALLAQVLHRLVRQGFNPVLIITEPTAGFGAVRDRARRLGYMALSILDEHDLKQWPAAGAGRSAWSRRSP